MRQVIVFILMCLSVLAETGSQSCYKFDKGSFAGTFSLTKDPEVIFSQEYVTEDIFSDFIDLQIDGKTVFDIECESIRPELKEGEKGCTLTDVGIITYYLKDKNLYLKADKMMIDYDHKRYLLQTKSDRFYKGIPIKCKQAKSVLDEDLDRDKSNRSLIRTIQAPLKVYLIQKRGNIVIVTGEDISPKALHLKKYTGEANSKVLLSHNNGNTWQDITENLDLAWDTIKKILIIDNTHFIASFYNAVSISTDGGKTWNWYQLNGDDTVDMVVKTDSAIVITTKEHRKYISNDKGKTWVPKIEKRGEY